jgi:hypothetical protein
VNQPPPRFIQLEDPSRASPATSTGVRLR